MARPAGELVVSQHWMPKPRPHVRRTAQGTAGRQSSGVLRTWVPHAHMHTRTPAYMHTSTHIAGVSSPFRLAGDTRGTPWASVYLMVMPVSVNLTPFLRHVFFNCLAQGLGARSASIGAHTTHNTYTHVPERKHKSVVRVLLCFHDWAARALPKI